MLGAAMTVAAVAAPASAEAAFGPLGQDFRISFMGPNGSTAYAGHGSAVAYNPTAGEYLVVWYGDDDTAPLVNDEFEIFGQRLSLGGAPLGGRIRVSAQGADGNPASTAAAPTVAYNATANEYLVAWIGEIGTTDDREIWGRRLSAAGARLGGSDDLQVSGMGPDGNPAYGALNPSIAYNPNANEYLVVWWGDDDTAPLVDGEFEIFGQRLTAAGAPTGTDDFRISEQGADGNPASSVAFPSIAYNQTANEYLVAWQGEIGTTNDVEIWSQRLSATGAEVGGNDLQVSGMGPDGNPAFTAGLPKVAANPTADEYLVVWHGDDDAGPLVDDEFEIFGQRLTAAGAQTGTNDFRISDMGPDASKNFAAYLPSVAANPTANEYLVSWEGDDDIAPLVDDEFEVFGQRLTAAGAQTGMNDFRISRQGPDGNKDYGTWSTSVASAPSRNEYLVAWAGDDYTPPFILGESEIFGRRLGEPPPPAGGGTPGGGGMPGEGGTPTGGGADTLAPRFLSLALSRTVFAAFSSRPSMRRARARGTRVSYRLSEAATATFRVQRVLAGRRVRGHCVRPSRANRGRRRCTRYRTLRGSFSHTGTAGRNRFRFSGRLRGRKLRPGRYRLVATATDAAANRSDPVRRLFRIIR